MKRYTSLALIGVLVVGIAGFISLDAFSATSFVTMKAASDIHETGQMIGHVTYELRDADGNIKHYFQSDNVIVDVGIDCAATAIFDTAGSSLKDDGTGTQVPICTLGTDGGFSFIAIGNSTTPFTLGEPLSTFDDTALDNDGTDGEINRLGGAVTITEANDGDTTVSIVSPQFEFLDLGLGGTAITQSGLFDSVAPTGAGESNNMFSARDIPGQSGTGLKVFNADTLSITWTITLQ